MKIKILCVLAVCKLKTKGVGLCLPANIWQYCKTCRFNIRPILRAKSSFSEVNEARLLLFYLLLCMLSHHIQILTMIFVCLCKCFKTKNSIAYWWKTQKQKCSRKYWKYWRKYWILLSTKVCFLRMSFTKLSCVFFKF